MTIWTTLLRSLGIQWPRSVAVRPRPTAIFPQQSTPLVPGEYRALYTYLEQRYASIVVLTFEQIDALLGFALPTPARTQRAWWTDTVDSQRHAAAWTAAGRTATPNLAAGTIAFERPV